MLHKKDEDILRSIQLTLGIGKIYNNGKDGKQLRVESLKELLILIKEIFFNMIFYKIKIISVI